MNDKIQIKKAIDNLYKAVMEVKDLGCSFDNLNFIVTNECVNLYDNNNLVGHMSYEEYKRVTSELLIFGESTFIHKEKKE